MNLEASFYREMQDIKALLLKQEIPDTYPEYISQIKANPYKNQYFIDRFDFINISSFALVAKRWAAPLAAYIGDAFCLEIMAGKGVLAKALHKYGVQITATDNYTWKWHRSPQEKTGRPLTVGELWHDVKDMDCVEAVTLYGRGVKYLLCSWPPYNDGDLHKSLLKMREVNPDCRLIYIGEEKGGCSANDLFFDAAQRIKGDEAFNKIARRYQNWPGMYGKVLLFK